MNPHRPVRGTEAPPDAWTATIDVSIDAEANISRDESLLRAGHAYIRVGVLNDRTVSLGVAQHREIPLVRRAEMEGIRVLPRRSGGSALLHLPGDVVFAIVVPRRHRLFPRRFVSSYDTLGSGIVSFLKSLGQRAEWSLPFGLSKDFCLFGERGQVLSVGDRAVGGAAQHVTDRALLHHGVVCTTLDRALLSRIFDLPGEPLATRLISLRELGIIAPPETIATSLLNYLQQSLSGIFGGEGDSNPT